MVASVVSYLSVQCGSVIMLGSSERSLTRNVPAQSEGKQFEETWLLLEFCDKGSLQDIMDRGAFRSVRIGIEGSQACPPSCSPVAQTSSLTCLV